MPVLTRRRILAAKLESVIGTAETLTASEANFHVIDPSFNEDTETNKRMHQASLGNAPQSPGPRAGDASFTVELGPTSDADWASVLLPACGFLDTTPTAGGSAFTLSSAVADYKTATLGLYQDGLLYEVYGAAMDMTVRGERGGRTLCEMTARGLWQKSAATILASTNTPTSQPDRLDDATLTIGGTAYNINSFELSLNNSLTLRTDINGFIAGIVVERDVTFSIDPEASTSQDWYADWAAGTEAALNFVLTTGGTGPSTCTIAASKLQLTGISPSDRDGLHVDQLEFQANGKDDELSITFA